MHRRNYNDWKLNSTANRAAKIIDIIDFNDPDILTLQETDKKTAKKLDSFLQDKGYSTFYEKRADDKPDGNYVGWKHDRFEVVQMTKKIDFEEEAKNSGFEFENLNDYMTKNIASRVVLREIRTQKMIAVYTTHLFWNPNFENVKYFQLTNLLQKIHKIDGKDIPFVLMGDFNCIPRYLAMSIFDKKTPSYDMLERRKNYQNVLKDISKVHEAFNFRVLDDLKPINAYKQYKGEII